MGSLGNPVDGGAVFAMTSTRGGRAWGKWLALCRQAEFAMLVDSKGDMPNTFLIEIIWVNVSIISFWIANHPSTQWFKTTTISLSLTILTDSAGWFLVMSAGAAVLLGLEWAGAV